MAKSDKRVIKRYANRKLYDTATRQFTTLDEIAQLVAAGRKVIVLDHDSGDDRTDEVLAQALGRRMRSAPAGSDLLAGLLRGPARIAMELADELTPKDEIPAKPEKVKKAGQGSGGKKATKPKKPKLVEDDSREAELQELRDQVSELTQAVTLLLQEKVAEKQAEIDNS